MEIEHDGRPTSGPTTNTAKVWEDVWKKTFDQMSTAPIPVAKVIKEFDRDILKRIGDSLHMLMPSVNISIRNATLEVMQRDMAKRESLLLPGTSIVETQEFYVLTMEMKFTAANPADFLKEPDVPMEEVKRVFRLEDK